MIQRWILVVCEQDRRASIDTQNEKRTRLFDFKRKKLSDGRKPCHEGKLPMCVTLFEGGRKLLFGREV